jgi:thermitase
MFTVTIILFGCWIILKEHSKHSSILGPLAITSLMVMVGNSFIHMASINSFMLGNAIAFLFLSFGSFVLLQLKDYRTIQIFSLVLFVFLGNILQNKNNVKKDEPLISLDEKAEILIEMAPENLHKLDKTKEKYNLTIAQAFAPMEITKTNLDEYFIIDVPNIHAKNLPEIMNILRKNREIIWLEPNEKIDFDFPQKATLPNKDNRMMTTDPSVGLQWHLSFLEMDKYYKIFTSENLKPVKKAKLFILDTGLDTRHEDLNGSFSGINDSQGHGTHCAGIAGAITNNGIGVASMSPNPEWIDIRAIQVIGTIGFGTQQQIIDGIIKASDQGADVISMSLGGITNQDREKAYNDAIKYANDKGAIVVVAAGNANLDGKRYSPANAENVISVASIQKNYQKSGFSNHVQNLTMGVCAPGENILSTTPSNSYTAMNGTSMATPQVAGLIAIMKAIRPELSTREVFNILNNSGKPTADTQKTGKLIQPYQAIIQLLGQ